MIALAFLTSASTAQEPLKGVALVIGNGAYQHLSKLPNPENDARAVEDLLNELGFETSVAADRDARRLRRDIEGLIDDAEGADVAIVYYSGHGIEAGGENFLVPVDADLSALDDASEKLVPLSDLLSELTAKVPVTIVLLDACRDNPFPAGAMVRIGSDLQASPIGTGGLAVTRGAAPLGHAGAQQPTQNLGQVLGFAAEPGKVALDGEPGGNSPYAAALIRHLGAMDGEEFGTVLRMVAEEVYLKTGGRQRPWVNESLRRLLYFGASAKSPGGEAGEILAERRRLLVTISTLPEPGRRAIEAISGDGGVPMDAVYAMLAALGTEAPSDPAELDRLLRSQTDRLKSIIAERETLKSRDPEIMRLAALSDEALGEGALNTAIEMLGRAKARVAELEAQVDEAEADIARKRAEFASVYVRSAQAHALSFDWTSSARDYALAFDQIERWDDRLASEYKSQESDAWTSQGKLKGDTGAFDDAIDAASRAVDIAARLSDKAQWAVSQNALGIALEGAGERDRDNGRLEAAIAAYRQSLTVLDAENSPQLWAGVQNNLANTLTTLGIRSRSADILREAMVAIEASAQQFYSLNDRRQWAMAQNNGGRTLLELGQIENSIDTIYRAGRAYENALSVVSRTGNPPLWATLQANLGNIYQTVGRMTTDAAQGLAWHQQAVTIFAEALSEMPRDRVPMQWATVQNNLANTHQMIAFRQSEAEALASLGLAATAQEAALSEMTRERTPLLWGTGKWNLARTQHMIAERTEAPAEAASRYRTAIATYEEAMLELSREQTASQWAGVQAGIGVAYQRLSQIEAERAGAHLAAAAAAQRAAIEALPFAERPLDRADVQHDLGMTLLLAGDAGGGIDFYRQSETVYREEMTVRSKESAPANWAKAQAGIGNAMRAIGLVTGDRATLTEARQRTEEARAAIQPFDTSYNGVLDQRLAEIDAALAKSN